MCDNHGNYWTLVQEKQGKYKLYRQDAVIPDKGVDMIEAFCQGGVFPAWVVIMLSIIINCAATTKEEKVSINSVIKATLLMFFIGGCFGILTM